jgi:hypothetical protein
MENMRQKYNISGNIKSYRRALGIAAFISTLPKDIFLNFYLVFSTYNAHNNWQSKERA